MAGAPVQVIAHRGASFDYPENTPAAFAAALDQGCDGIELDLQLTRDRVPVVYHDRNLARLALPRRQVADLTLAELRARAAASDLYGPSPDRSIATIDEVLARFGHRTRLYLEVKTRERGAAGRLRHLDLMQRTIAAVRAHSLQARVSILSFDRELLEVCARAAPELPRVLNVRPVAGDRRSDPATLLSSVPGGIAALSADISTLTPGYAARVRAAGCPLLVFVCNEVEQVRVAVEAAAVGIMSDRPGWLRDVLAPSIISQPPPVPAPRGESA